MSLTYKLFRAVFGLIILLLSFPSLALFGEGENIIDVSNIPNSLEADPHVYYLEDTDQGLTVNDFITGSASDALIPSPGGVLNRGYSKAAIWLRLRLNITNPQSLAKVEKVLQIQYPLLDHISVYQVIGDQLDKEWVTGDSLPFKQRPVDHNS